MYVTPDRFQQHIEHKKYICQRIRCFSSVSIVAESGYPISTKISAQSVRPPSLSGKAVQQAAARMDRLGMHVIKAGMLLLTLQLLAPTRSSSFVRRLLLVHWLRLLLLRLLLTWTNWKSCCWIWEMFMFYTVLLVPIPNEVVKMRKMWGIKVAESNVCMSLKIFNYYGTGRLFVLRSILRATNLLGPQKRRKEKLWVKKREGGREGNWLI